MKKILMTMLGVVGLLCSTSCSDEEIVSGVEGDAMVQFTVELADGGDASRAAISDGTTVDKVYYEVYTNVKGTQTAMDALKGEATIEGKQATVNLALVKGQAYDVVFWASKAGVYETSDLKKVTVKDQTSINAGKANDETRDAFTAVYRTAKVTGPIKETIKLYRPFAQINFGTLLSDMQNAEKAGAKLTVSKINVSNLADYYNALSEEGCVNEGEELKTLEFGENAIPNRDEQELTFGEGVTPTYEYLATAYVLFAGKATDQVTTDLTMTVPTGLNQDVVLSVPNAPAQRNYRTNVLGNLLTNQAEFNIVVDPIYNTPDNNIEAWNGNIEEPAYDAATKTYTVENAAQLAWFSENSVKAVTINIVNDIDINGKIWKPATTLGAGDYKVTINGNGKTISNYKINSTSKNQGLFSVVYGTIKDLNVEYVDVKAAGRAGALVGQVFGKVINCHAKHVSVVVKCEKASSGVFEDADKAGALIGQVAEVTNTYEVTNCSVEDATIWGYRDLGSIVGYSNDEDLNGFVGNSAKNVTITVDMMYHLPYEEGKAQNVAEFVGNRPALTGTAENVKIVYEAPAVLNGKGYATLGSALADVQSGDVITVAAGNHKMSAITNKEITIQGGRDAVLDMTPIHDAQLHGVSFIFDGVTVNFSNDIYHGLKHTASVKYTDCAINGLQFLYAPAVFEGCDLNSNGAEHCVWTYGSDNAIFTNCTFTYSDRAVNCYSDQKEQATEATFTGCTFTKVAGKEVSGALETNSSLMVSLKLNISNCTINEGELWWISEWDSKDGANTTVTVDNTVVFPVAFIGGKGYPSLNEALKAAVNGDEVKVNTGVYYPANAGGKKITVSAMENSEVTFKLKNQGEDGCDYGFGSSGTGVGTYVFNNITFDTSENTGNYKGYAYMGATYNNCNFVGAWSLNNENDYTFKNCTFDFKNGYFWTWGGRSITFDGCTFNGNSKCILAHGWASTEININNCAFAATEKGYASGGTVWTAAVEIDPAGTNTYTINFTGNNTKTENYAGWTRIKDDSTGHVISGLE